MLLSPHECGLYAYTTQARLYFASMKYHYMSSELQHPLVKNFPSPLLEGGGQAACKNNKPLNQVTVILTHYQ